MRIWDATARRAATTRYTDMPWPRPWQVHDSLSQTLLRKALGIDAGHLLIVKLPQDGEQVSGDVLLRPAASNTFYLEMIIDGGQVGIGLESTIIDLTEESPRILRPLGGVDLPGGGGVQGVSS